MRAPLQHEIVSLIGRGFHRPRDLLRVLGRSYRIRPATIWNAVYRLAQRGAIRRVRRGWYEAE
jgi:hypothetical protein